MKFTADEARVLKQYGELPEHIRWGCVLCATFSVLVVHDPLHSSMRCDTIVVTIM
jgi:hypothetical protein